MQSIKAGLIPLNKHNKEAKDCYSFKKLQEQLFLLKNEEQSEEKQRKIQQCSQLFRQLFDNQPPKAMDCVELNISCFQEYKSDVDYLDEDSQSNYEQCIVKLTKSIKQYVLSYGDKKSSEFQSPFGLSNSQKSSSEVSKENKMHIQQTNVTNLFKKLPSFQKQNSGNELTRKVSKKQDNDNLSATVQPNEAIKEAPNRSSFYTDTYYIQPQEQIKISLQPQKSSSQQTKKDQIFSQQESMFRQDIMKYYIYCCRCQKLATKKADIVKLFDFRNIAVGLKRNACS